MPNIDKLLEKSSKKKFKKSDYRPWNYLEEIEKEEFEKKSKNEIKPEQVQIEEKKEDIVEPQIKDDEIIFQSANSEPKIKYEHENHLANPVAPEKKIPANIKSSKKTIKNEIILSQSDSLLYTILRLAGHQKIIFSLVLEKCLNQDTLTTGIVTGQMLTTLTNTTLTMVNTSIQRLIEKKLMTREAGKRGRGGFYCFGISQEVKDAASEYLRLAQTDNWSATLKENGLEKPEGDLENNLFKHSGMLPKEWDQIDIDPLSDIKFSRNHLLQLYKQKNLNPELIQDSINHFAFDLKYNNKTKNITKTTPIGYFMGILRRSGIYNAPQNYESPHDKALRELLARKKTENEQREKMLKELINLAFEEWQSKLNQEEKDKILPDEIRNSRLTGAKIASLRTYFVNHIWPKIANAESFYKENENNANLANTDEY